MKNFMLAILLIICVIVTVACAPNNLDNIPPADTIPTITTPAETTSAPGVDVQNAVKDYFDWQPPQNYFVVENYEDLQAVYDMASEIPKITEYLVVEGNWRQARKENTYDQEYFKTGFLIAIMRKSNSMEEKSTYNINSVTGSIIRISMSSYETQVEFPAAYLDIIPIEGQYKGQEISLSLIYNPLP